MSRRIFSSFGLVLTVGCGLAACGSGEEAVAPAGPQMTAERPSSSGVNRPPVIDRIRFDPPMPVRGDRIRAVDPDIT